MRRRRETAGVHYVRYDEYRVAATDSVECILESMADGDHRAGGGDRLNRARLLKVRERSAQVHAGVFSKHEGNAELGGQFAGYVPCE